MRHCSFLLTIVLALAISSCAGDDPAGNDPAGNEPATAVATSIALSTASVTFASLQSTQTITATVKDQRDTPMIGAQVSWVSSDTAVATVSSAGVVTALRNGAATVTARSGSASANASVSVAQVATTISIGGPTTRSVAMGDTVRLVADVRDAGSHPVAGMVVTWSSSDATVARVSTSGLVTGIRNGAATIMAAAGTIGNASVALNVANVRVESIPTSLATPAPGALWEIPVVIVRYIPTLDGVNVDASEGGMSGTLDQIRNRIGVFEERIKFMLEEGSRFRGYRDAGAPYSLGYRVVHIQTVYEHFQRGREVPWNPGHYFPDYHRILGLANAESWVKERGVKEFWIWGYHSNQFEQPESNMSSPRTGDISNSSRFPDDLPVYDRTYTVYGYNFARTQAEAVHNHGHQLEAILGHSDRALFWKEFVGRNADDTQFVTGRAGWTHMPPNTTQDYDYHNPTPVLSDIADWKPGGGTKSPVSLSTWAGLSYAWPSSRAPGESAIFQQAESQWYVYWMQNMPGRNNTITHGTGQLTNWWRLTGDWDGAIAAGYRLSTTAGTITIRNNYTGGIALSPGGGLNPGQVATLNSTAPITVSVWDCGEPGGCKWDPYVLQPGKSYAVISDPAGPAANLKIVEI